MRCRWGSPGAHAGAAHGITSRVFDAHVDLVQRHGEVENGVTRDRHREGQAVVSASHQLPPSTQMLPIVPGASRKE